MKLLLTLLTFVSVLFIFSSCSGGKTPILMSEIGEPVDSEFSETGNNIIYPNVLGAWEVKVDTINLTAEVIPARNAAAIGNTFDSDLSQFLTVSPCSNCLMLGGVRIGEDELLQLDIYMRHPFKDITKRPDLHGFDVRAIFMNPTTWSTTIPIKYTKLDGNEEDLTCDPWFLLNADGFTSHFDELVLDDRYFIHGEDCPTALNPYLRFFESYQTGTFDPHAPSGYNVMPVGSSNSMKTAVFYGNTGAEFTFYIVADVAYGQSAVLANRTSPQYYLPAFNRTEPWRMEYWIENNNLSVSDSNATADVVVQVFDWQHNATVDPAYPNPSNLPGIRESSKVTQVILSLPNLMNNNVVATVPESGDGSPQNPLQFRLQVKNEKLAQWDTIWGIIAIRDELYGSAAPSGRLPIPVSPAGFPYETQDIRDYSYYGNIEVNMPDSEWGDETYKSELHIDYSQLIRASNAMIIADFFMDPSHKKFQYRWDYDYDGTTFDIDGAGLPSPYFPISEGKTNVGFRIRTNSVPPREYIYTIPVYKEGVEYDKQVSYQGEKFSITSSRRSNSIAVIGGKVCVAYSSIMTGPRNIYIVIYDHRLQSTLTSMVANNIGACYDPVLAVVEEGPNAGVYIVFACIDGAEKKIMSNYGNPFSGGFSNTNIKTIATTSLLGSAINQPALIYNNGVLTAYYHKHGIIPVFYDNIFVSQSTDYAQTWSSGQLVDPTSDYQSNPAATYFDRDHRYYVVWEDRKDLATRGSDLRMANSSDGLTYGTPENLSTTYGVIHEIAPSIANYNRQIGIAYLQHDDGSYRKDLYLKVINVPSYSHNTVRLENVVGDESFLAPSIGMASERVFTIAYGHHHYATDVNTLRLAVIRQTNAGWFQKTFYPDELLGLKTNDELDPYPAVVSKSAINGYAIESFIAHRSFRDGADDDPNPFPEKFGYIDVMSIVARGDN